MSNQTIHPKDNAQPGVVPPNTSMLFLLAVMMVTLLASGIAGKIGERMAGRGGYLIGSYGVAVLVSLAVCFLFGKLRHWTHSLYWLFGVPLALAGLHLSPIAFPGFSSESGSDQILSACAGFAGWMIGGTIATLVIQLAYNGKKRLDHDNSVLKG